MDGCGLRAIYDYTQDFSDEEALMARWVWFKDPISPFSEFWERKYVCGTYSHNPKKLTSQ